MNIFKREEKCIRLRFAECTDMYSCSYFRFKCYLSGDAVVYHLFLTMKQYMNQSHRKVS